MAIVEPIPEAFTEWLMAPEAPELDDFIQRPAWQQQAACRGRGPKAWFPFAWGDTKQAKALCAVCVVRQPCLEYALDAGPTLVGIWGGTSERERRRLRGDSLNSYR